MNNYLKENLDQNPEAMPVTVIVILIVKGRGSGANRQVVEVTTMTAMMMDMSVVIVLKLKLVDGLNIMVVKSHVKIEMVHMILNLMMVNVNQVLKQVKSNRRKSSKEIIKS